MASTRSNESRGFDGSLRDTFGRRVEDLRLSVTDRCNFRCDYCADDCVLHADPERLLSLDELIRIADICSRMGVTRVRVTGGEPTLRPGLEKLFRGLAGLSLSDIAMTTNGSRVNDQSASRWRRAGLRRITISLDSLRPERFGAITRSRCSVERVLASIECAKRAGLDPVRINAVVIRGMNDDEIVDLAALARRFDVDVRLIEYMPLVATRAWTPGAVVTADEMVDTISEVYPLTRVGQDRPSSPSRMYAFADGAPGRVGTIASVTRPFCSSCSRIRITADGMIRPCLFSLQEWDILSVLRTHPGPAGDAEVARFLSTAVGSKQEGHGISSRSFIQPTRSMTAIGG